MSIPTQEEIFDRFPKLFSQKDLSIQESCMAWGLSHGEGWNPIIVELCEKIKNHYTKLAEQGMVIVPIGEEEPENLEEDKFVYEVEFAQVKSKWYQLCVYYIGGDDKIREFVNEAESKSLEICEGCGCDFPDKGMSFCDNCRTGKSKFPEST